jgi:enoyl-CoA hydratase/carnithine racemase
MFDTKFETIRLDWPDGPEGLVQLTLNRPGSANAINPLMAVEILEAIERIEADPASRVLAITGAGKHFCGGADLRAARDENEGPPSVEFIDALAASPLPVIAAINGVAFGGGFEIAIACDFRLISAGASIGLPEVKFGGLPGGGGTQRVARVAGPAIAKRLIMLAEPLTARAALEFGLVDQIAEPADLIPATKALAQTLISRPAFALTAAKRAIDDGLDLPIAEGLELERVGVREHITPEMRRAAEASIAGTDPVYGRIFASS